MGAAALKAGHSKGIEFLTDALGTVRTVVDDTGTVIQNYEFNEHGLPMPGSGSGTGTFSPKTYQGALSVNDDRNDSGLYLMGHRHYAADLGRFISRDPIGFRGGLNLFNGAGTNPVTYVDPSGLDTLVLITGPGRGNPAGHTAIGIEGIGLFNLGTAETGFGLGEMSIEDYIQQELPYRDVEVFRIKTTEAQERYIADKLRGCDPKVDTPAEVDSYCTGNVCTRVTASPLEDLGLVDKGPNLGWEGVSPLGWAYTRSVNPFGRAAQVVAAGLPSTLRGRLRARGYESTTYSRPRPTPPLRVPPAVTRPQCSSRRESI